MKADQIILGQIYTLDTDKMCVDAMVVKKGVIVYLGSKDTALKMKGPNTQVIDYEDAVIYPGFMDAHTHGIVAGQRLAFQCNLSSGNSMQEYAEMIKKYISDNPGRSNYKGSGWIYHEEPMKDLLDAVSPDVPVLLNSADGHSMWLNSKALEKCGIDKEFAKEKGPALVHVDENGNPSGMVTETVSLYVSRQFQSTIQEIKEGLLAWQDFAFSQGITAVGEALLSVSPDGAKAYSELVAEGKWKLRTYAYTETQGNVKITTPEKIGEELHELAKKYDSEYFKILGSKFILDGVVEAHTAYLQDSYCDQNNYKGIINIQEKEILTKAIISANNKGFSYHIHTIGDGAVKFALDSIQKAQETTCNFDARNSLAHLQLVNDEDIKRCADYNVGAVVAPLWACVEPNYMEQTIKYIGEERASKQYPIKSFEDEGATIAFHTDYPISSKMDVPLSVYRSIKRDIPNKEDTALWPEQGISAYRALLAMTINTAYLFRQEHKLGTLAIGKVANASVYDRDFIEYKDVNDIPNTKLLATIIDGQEVYKINNDNRRQ